MKVIVKQGKLRHYVILKGDNGETIMNSQHYYSKGNAKRAGKKLADALDIPLKVLG